MPPGSTTSPTLRRLSLTKPVSSCPMRAGADSRPDGGWPRPGGPPAEGGRGSVLPSGRGADVEFRILGPLGVLATATRSSGIERGPCGPARRISLAYRGAASPARINQTRAGRPAAHLEKFGDRVRGDSPDRPHGGE